MSIIDVTSTTVVSIIRKPLKSTARRKWARTPVAICMKSNYWLSILLSLKITYVSWIIHGPAPPFGCTANTVLRRTASDGRTREQDEAKAKKEGRQVRERAWYWCIKRAYLRSLFSRMWTPGMRAGIREVSRVAVAGKERARAEDRTASRRAAQRHLFILPRRMDRELVCGAWMYAGTSARGIYLTGARTCDAESANPPRFP